MADTVQNVLHVVPGGAADRVRELGAEHVVEFPDTLSHGPSRKEPKRHREVRLEYWRSLYGRLLGRPEAPDVERALAELRDGYLSTEQLGSVMKHHAEDRRVVLWSTPTFRDRLFLWFCFEATQRAEIEADRVATAEPQVPVSPEEDAYFALRDLELEEIAEGFEALVYPEPIYVQTGAQLWQTFSSGSPREFAISVPHTEKFFPNIAQLAEDYGALFPWAAGEDAARLQISNFDRALLEAVPTDAWRTPYEVLGERFIEDVPFIDDLAVGARLVDWSGAEDGEQYLECREENSEAGPLDRLSFRRTDRGDQILEQGMGPEERPPVFEIGDCRIYAGAEPWARVVEDEFWWFERLEPGDDSDAE